MSIFLNIARVSPAAFAKIKADPSLLEGIFFGDDESTATSLGISEDDSGGIDYSLVNDGLEQMSEATGEELEGDDPVLTDLGSSGELAHDAGYGPAFYVEPAAVQNKATRSMVCHTDEDLDVIINSAAEAGDYLVGVLS